MTQRVQSPSERAWDRLTGFLIGNKLVVFMALALMVGAGLSVSPLPIEIDGLPRDPVPVDALPDISENQQIVFTKWPGRSPRDVEDQVTYPLTTTLLGIPGVKSVRSSSVMGFSSIYLIFQDDVEFYWSRSRVLEKLASLPAGTLPAGAVPQLGPDATALGQVYWYTLQARYEDGSIAAGAFDLHELRSVQDWTVRYALQSVAGVSEVASVGGHVREYQVDVDPEAMLAHGVSIGQVANAVRQANLDVGARTLELNRVEYLIRGLGFIEQLEDLEEVVIATRQHTPIRVRDVAHVAFGPAERRGALDDGGAPAVGGVVVVRFGDNPLEVIERIRQKIEEVSPGLPRRTMEDGRVARVEIVPFYDRTRLIEETLGTLTDTLLQQVLVTVIVILLILGRLGVSLLVSLLLPLGVLATFGAMKLFGVNANVMALSGIAIAVGTMVDMGIVFTENMTRHLSKAPGDDDGRARALRTATAEVAPALLTSILTTVVGFLPVFGLAAAEGKLFTPLAYTKTFALLAAFVVAAVALPPLAHLVLRRSRVPTPLSRGLNWALAAAAVVLVSDLWMPLGRDRTLLLNVVFVALLFGLALGAFALVLRFYEPVLRAALRNKTLFLAANGLVLAAGLGAWLGVPGQWAGLRSDFMPAFDEGSYLYMPTTTPHASLGQSIEMLSDIDAAIAAIPEVESAVGKIGRADSALDPAPISMVETVINYKPEFALGPDGEQVRQWRDHIRSPRDIWDEIVKAAAAPGLTGAPRLMPIKTRIVMLQSGMRSAVGIKVRGPDLDTIEGFALQLETLLRESTAIAPETVFADRIVGKPYIELEIDRGAIARHGLAIRNVQDVIQIAIGGRRLTATVEGRERYPVRVRYMREERDTVEALARVRVPMANGEQIPLGDLIHIRYVRGPQMIRSEDTFLTAYVTFDPAEGVGEVGSVEAARALIDERIASGTLVVPEGVSMKFAGTYENQLRSQERLKVLVPVALMIIFVLLQLQFRRVTTALMVFSGLLLAASGGFLLIAAYGTDGFMNLSAGGVDLRQLFQIQETPMTVAVWVGFLALFGIATDNGVIVATYLDQRFRDAQPADTAAVHDLVVEAGIRRLKPCLMTTATTALAMLPILTSQGRGADLMIPMALPTAGGVVMSVLTLVTVPVLYSIVAERQAGAVA